jgi:uncharacterized protein
MRIVVDGYNYIRQTDLRRFEIISLERGRNELIKRLATYKRAKGYNITVVFDGIIGGAISRERDRSAGISIIYSRRGETADEVIKLLIEKSAEELIVVSSDRAIALAAERKGFTPVNSRTFAGKIADAESWSSMEKEDDHSLRKDKKGPSRRVPRRKRTDQKNIDRL